jgi:hypothetical protein
VPTQWASAASRCCCTTIAVGNDVRAGEEEGRVVRRATPRFESRRVGAGQSPVDRRRADSDVDRVLRRDAVNSEECKRKKQQAHHWRSNCALATIGAQGVGAM